MFHSKMRREQVLLSEYIGSMKADVQLWARVRYWGEMEKNIIFMYTSWVKIRVEVAHKIKKHLVAIQHHMSIRVKKCKQDQGSTTWSGNNWTYLNHPHCQNHQQFSLLQWGRRLRPITGWAICLRNQHFSGPGFSGFWIFPEHFWAE